MNLLDRLHPAQSLRLIHLQHEIAVLEEAQACITNDPAAWGRVDSLIDVRRDQMVAVLQATQGGDISQLNLRA